MTEKQKQSVFHSMDNIRDNLTGRVVSAARRGNLPAVKQWLDAIIEDAHAAKAWLERKEGETGQ